MGLHHKGLVVPCYRAIAASHAKAGQSFDLPRADQDHRLIGRQLRHHRDSLPEPTASHVLTLNWKGGTHPGNDSHTRSLQLQPHHFCTADTCPPDRAPTAPLIVEALDTPTWLKGSQFRTAEPARWLIPSFFGQEEACNCATGPDNEGACCTADQTS
jgi:hypothetical protein